MVTHSCVLLSGVNQNGTKPPDSGKAGFRMVSSFWAVCCIYLSSSLFLFSRLLKSTTLCQKTHRLLPTKGHNMNDV